MVIVGENLRELIQQHGIVAATDAFDETSITLRLDSSVAWLEPADGETITYLEDLPESWIRKGTISSDGLILPAKSCVLACSTEKVYMPPGYMGLIQTKGSLARLFVLVQCADGQVDSGFRGKLTFEICNLGSHAVRLKRNSKIAQLFILHGSTRDVVPYDGRYQGAEGPTWQLPPDKKATGVRDS